jgi:hypothetical protein
VLRRHGLYSSHVTEWRKARNAGALAGLSAPRGRPPTDPVERENARLQKENEQLARELANARLVFEVQGKVSALLEQLSGSADPRLDPAAGSNRPWPMAAPGSHGEHGGATARNVRRDSPRGQRRCLA